MAEQRTVVYLRCRSDACGIHLDAGPADAREAPSDARTRLLQRALELISGGHGEAASPGRDRSDVPDLTAEEAMLLARTVLDRYCQG